MAADSRLSNRDTCKDVLWENTFVFTCCVLKSKPRNVAESGETLIFSFTGYKWPALLKTVLTAHTYDQVKATNTQLTTFRTRRCNWSCRQKTFSYSAWVVTADFIYPQSSVYLHLLHEYLLSKSKIIYPYTECICFF